jgi:hypothetical protein
MWGIVIDGAGVLDGHTFNTRRRALLAKAERYPDNPLYRVKRLAVALDPEKRTAPRQGDSHAER